MLLAPGCPSWKLTAINDAGVTFVKTYIKFLATCEARKLEIVPYESFIYYIRTRVVYNIYTVSE